jgi:hypothetical protein
MPRIDPLPREALGDDLNTLLATAEKPHGVRPQFPAHPGATARHHARLRPIGRGDQRCVVDDQPAAAQLGFAIGEPRRRVWLL